MGYDDILKRRRKHANMTQNEVAHKLRCSIMTVSTSERPYRDTKQLPSEQYIKKFANFFGVNPDDKLDLERQLMVERALINLPPIVAEQFRESLSSHGIANSGAMTLAFRNKLEADWKDVKDNAKKQYDRELIQTVISGERLLSRDGVIALAQALGRDPETYLAVAQMMTEEMRNFTIRYKRGPDLIRLLNRLDQEDSDLFMNTFLYSLDLYLQTHKHKSILKNNRPKKKECKNKKKPLPIL